MILTWLFFYFIHSNIYTHVIFSTFVLLYGYEGNDNIQWILDQNGLSNRSIASKLDSWLMKKRDIIMGLNKRIIDNQKSRGFLLLLLLLLFFMKRK